MASPSVVHQAILRELLLEFGNHLRSKPCLVLKSRLMNCGQERMFNGVKNLKDLYR